MEGKRPEDELSPFDLPEEAIDPDDDLVGAQPAVGGAGRGLIPDSVKKAILSGVGALFMTEEGARRLAREWKLPKELIGFIGQQAQGAKDEILRVLSDEIRNFLQSDVVRRELGKALASMAVEVHAEIHLRPAEEGMPRPEVRASVRPRAGARTEAGTSRGRRREPHGKRRR